MSMESKSYQYPNKKELELEFLRNYGENFLGLNSLKIGDVIEIEFPYQTCYRNEKRELVSASWKRVEKGVLKYDENNVLYAESIENLPFYPYGSNGKRGRLEKREPVYRPKKSIVKFGTGFIH